ncbi:MAG: hypothetical protein ACRDJE_05195 [Dehalococcoidia bacterium]
MADADEISVQTWRHPRGWIIVPLLFPLSGRVPWNVDRMLNTGRPQSCLGQRARDALAAMGHITPSTRTAFTLHNARLGGVRLPDIAMRLSAGPTLLQLEGMLGLDFLEQFAEVRFDVRTLRLTLVRG